MADQPLLPLLLLKEADEETIEGSTRFQKLVFLAQKEPDPPLAEDYQYEYYSYKYGPFSKELAEDLDELSEDGYLSVEKDRSPSGDKYVYRLTEEGQEKVEELQDQLRVRFRESPLPEDWADEAVNNVRRIEDVFNNMPVMSLIEYVYNHYEEYTDKSELDIS